MRQYICEYQFTYHFIPPDIQAYVNPNNLLLPTWAPLKPTWISRITNQWGVYSNSEAITYSRYSHNNINYIVFNYLDECPQYSRLYFPIHELKLARV